MYFKTLRWALALIVAIVYLTGFQVFTGIEGLALAAIAPATLDDKGINKQWRSLSQDSFWLSLWKSAFSDPSYTGTNKSRRSIEPRNDMMGAPFVEYYDLQRLKGDRLTDTIHIPPFDGDDEVLFGTGSDAGYVRVKGQNRIGYEIQGNRKNIDFCLQTYFFSAFEEDINMSEQELGGELMPLLMEHLTDLHGRYYDADKIMAYHLNYSPHVYTRIAQADDGISTGDPVGGSTSLGVPAPFEHPNTFAWINPGTIADPEYALVSANDVVGAAADTNTATSWTGKVHETVGKVTSDALPGRKMLDQIMRQTKLLKIVPIRYVSGNGASEGMYLLLVSPAMMNMLIDDTDLQARFDSAFQGAMYDHPLINESDKIYRKLVIREIEKFEQPLYTYQYNYADAYDYGATADGGLDARPTITGGQDTTGMSYTITGAGRDKRISLSLGERQFRPSADPALDADNAQPAAEDTAIGSYGGDKIDRVVLLGASAVGCVPGPIFPLERRQEDDYGNILGIGQEKLAASRRIDFPTSRAHNSGYDNQGSMTIAVFNGK
jgi:hypothetical protein